MRCLKCNTVNPDGSIYCCKCGNKLPANDNQNNSPSKYQPLEMVFYFCDEVFVFSPNYSMVADVFNLFLNEAWDSYVELKRVFSEKGKSLDGAIRYSGPAFMDCIKKLADTLYGICLKLDIRSYNFVEFNTLFCEICDLENRLSPLFEAAETLNEFAEQLDSYRSAQRNSRGHWEGGGFGIRGAVKGAIKAGLLNAGTKAVYSISDSLTDQKDLRELNKLDMQLYSKVRPTSLLKQLFIDCCESACRLFVMLFSKTHNLSDLEDGFDEIDYLNRQYQSDAEIIYRFGVDEDDTEIDNLLDSIIERIKAYPFDLYPYWDYLNYTYDDFSSVESVFSILHIEPLYRMQYDKELTENGYKLSNKKYSSLDELDDAIDTLKWLSTSKFYNPSYNSTIEKLERKRLEFM